MSLTEAQSSRVKKMLTRETLLKDIEAINVAAQSAIGTKQSAIVVLQNQRIVDVKTKRDAIKALDI